MSKKFIFQILCLVYLLFIYSMEIINKDWNGLYRSFTTILMVFFVLSIFEYFNVRNIIEIKILKQLFRKNKVKDFEMIFGDGVFFGYKKEEISGKSLLPLKEINEKMMEINEEIGEKEELNNRFN